MQKKQLLIGIDEFTLTILLKDKTLSDKWSYYAQKIISDFVRYSLVETVLDGQLEEMENGKLQGYSRAYNLGLKDYYFAIAYHPNHPNMGVCIRFSAKAWAIYQAQYSKLYAQEIILPEFLHMIADNIDEIVRLTRIDMTADYFNYDLNLFELYSALSSGKIIVKRDNRITGFKNISFYGKNKKIETIYVGSRKANSRAFLRIYDKRLEQIETNGFRISEALDCTNWIRFEAVFKGLYAHSISTEMLKSHMTKDDLKKYVSQIITQKYIFYDCENNVCTEYTNDLLNTASGSGFAKLRCESPRDNALKQNIAHIRNGSGLFPTLYKIRSLYGKSADQAFLKYLYNLYQTESWLSLEMRKELKLWLKKHENLREISLEDNY